MRILIFGASGQDGIYLDKLCKSLGNDTRCFGNNRGRLRLDVSNKEAVNRVIAEYKPDICFHLAAVSSTRHSHAFANHDAISTGTINILEACYNNVPSAKVFITGSGVQFKNKGLPISENCEFAPSSPYSVARIHSVYLSRYYRSLGMKVYIGYLFHHESPQRTAGHVSQKVVQAAKRIANGSQEILEMGDLSVSKEWTFAGDVVEGIWALVNQDSVFEATIGSGKTYTIDQWVQICFRLLGIDKSSYVQQIEEFSPEYSILVSNPNTINKIGWKPTVGIEQLAQLMIDEELDTLVT